MFDSLDQGHTVDNDVMVAGYVLMRVALLSLWWQVSRHDAQRAPAARKYMVAVGGAQLGWIALALSDLEIAPLLPFLVLLIGLELAGPYRAERRAPTPWHAGHIAERYGLLVIITLGEVILGTVASLNAIVHGEAGWTVDAALLALAGVGLTFGCWWMYFSVPWEKALRHHRERGFPFGYGHLLLFAALAAMGGGLHVAAYTLEHEAHIGTTATVLTVAVPLAVYAAVLFGLYSIVFRTTDPFHLGLIAGTAAIMALGVLLAAGGAAVTTCLLVLMLAPILTVIGYETVGHRHLAEAVQRL
jgi:low temperature requirement protein LtrA